VGGTISSETNEPLETHYSNNVISVIENFEFYSDLKIGKI